MNRPMNILDFQARKQLLLARIALQRAELRGEMAHVRQAARVPDLLRAAIGFGSGKSFFGIDAGKDSWMGTALSLLRRYRMAAALLGGVAPLLGGRRGWQRVVRLGLITLAAAVWYGWRAARHRGR